MEKIDTLVIGAGQAGLAISYLLTDASIDHIVLEKDRMLKSWRDQRWDSFTLVTPNWTINLPGKKYQGDDPDGFLTIKETIKFLEEYAREFDPPIKEGVEVTAVNSEDDSDGYIVRTSDGDYRANNVVVAAGTFQEPNIPPYSRKITENVMQIHSSKYKNPSQLPPGAVLVVGSGQSGCQIAEELNESGREVYLSTSRNRRMPRRYRGKDTMSWIFKTSMADQTVEDLDSPGDRFAPNPHVSGKNGGHTINLHQFCRDGIHLLGHMQNVNGTQVRFKPDLMQNLKAADTFAAEFKKGVDKFIEENGLDSPEEDEPQLKDGFSSPLITILDLEEKDIQSIIWATGYKFDFSWVDYPIFDEYGYPKQERGVTEQPGLYFLGLHWMHTLKSGLLIGMGEDARYIMNHIEQSK